MAQGYRLPLADRCLSAPTRPRGHLNIVTTKNALLPFHIVDVFAVAPLTGNPLAVVNGGADLPLDLLQRIAREFNQSETTFVLPPTRPNADWRLRSFTAIGAEVFGAGHNALGDDFTIRRSTRPCRHGARTTCDWHRV